MDGVPGLWSQPTPLIGRRAELRRVAELLADPTCRLISLVGPGGIGKTRLAVETAARFAQTAVFVPLQPVALVDLIVTAVIEALGLQRTSDGEPKAQLLDYLGKRRLLLVLDNFEQLLDGTSLLAELLAHAPGLKLLVTSRERLNIREEWVISVGGLPFPTDGVSAAVETYDAVQLFTQSARRVNPGFLLAEEAESVARLCALLDGMPLALELAASWVRVLTCAEIAAEVERSLDVLETTARDVPARHRSMRAVLDHSWKLLTEAQRQVFMRLTVFRGGFRREAAEQVAGASRSVLAAQLDKSWLRRDPGGRCDIHELLRQYGAERLAESPAAFLDAQDRHGRYFCAFLADCWPRLTGSQIKAAFADIEAELDNIRAAWDWALRGHRAVEIASTLDSLWFFYEEQMRHQEGEQAFAAASAAFDDDSLTSAKIRARQGALCFMMGLPEKANTLLRDSVAILRRANAPADLAFALHRLAVLIKDDGPDCSEGIDCLKESLVLFQSVGDDFSVGHVLHWLNLLYRLQCSEASREDASEQSRRYAWEALRHYQRAGSTWGIGQAWLGLSSVAAAAGDDEQARQYAARSFACFREIGTYWGTAVSLAQLGVAECALGRFAEARRRALQGLQLFVERRLTALDHFSLHVLLLVVRIWLDEGETERAYELMGVIDHRGEQLGWETRMQTLNALAQRDNPWPLPLGAAFERGRLRDFDEVVAEIIADLSEDAAETPVSEIADPLTARELEILHLAAESLTNREIAARLVLAPGTVKWYLSEIYGKLGVNGRMQAVTRARALRLVD